jgi:hypothetical protein
MAVRVRNGRYVIDYYPNGRSGKRVRITLPSGTAEGRAMELEKEYRSRPVLFVVYDDTIGNLIGKFYEHVGLVRKQSSVRSIQNCFDGPLGVYFRPIRVSEIAPEQIEKYKELRLLEGAGAGTVNKEISYLSTLLRWAETRLNLRPNADLNIKKLHAGSVLKAVREGGPRLYIIENRLAACEQNIQFVDDEPSEPPEPPEPVVRHFDSPPPEASIIVDAAPGTAAPSIAAAPSILYMPETCDTETCNPKTRDDAPGRKADFTELINARQRRVDAQAVQEGESDAATGELSKYLVGRRKGANISLAEMVRRTNISPGYFKALENQEFDKMPGGFFVEGYIREYMKALSIDPAEAVAIYHRIVKPEESVPVCTVRKSPRFAYALLTIMAIILMVLLFYGVLDIGDIVYEKYRAIIKVFHDTPV